MRKREFKERYFNYLVSLVCNEYHERYFYKLLSHLHNREFVWENPKDESRALDGLYLRQEFCREFGYPNLPYFPENCTVLEMLVALAKRMEFDILGDSRYGDRTGEWFWLMLRNSNLDGMDDGDYDIDFVNMCIDTILYRTYNRDGRGSLFYIPNSKRDMRKVEIWYQMNYYINESLIHDVSKTMSLD